MCQSGEDLAEVGRSCRWKFPRLAISAQSASGAELDSDCWDYRFDRPTRFSANLGLLFATSLFMRSLATDSEAGASGFSPKLERAPAGKA